MNFKNFLRQHRKAFTLAEVVIVMAILSVMMVAFAPVVTKKSTSPTDTFRTFIKTGGGDGIYYNSSASTYKPVLIGTNSLAADYNLEPKLVINTDDNSAHPHIAFLNNETGAGYMYMKGSSIINMADGLIEMSTGRTAIGTDACKDASADVANIMCIGYNSGKGNSTVGNSIYIGDSSIEYSADNIYFGNKKLSEYMPQISYGVNSNGLPTIQIGDPSIHFTKKRVFIGDDDIYAMDTGTFESDIRLKNVGKPFKAGLDMLAKINPVNFTYKRDENKVPHVGVIAQDLEKIFPDAVHTNKEGYLYIRTEDMFYTAINAIKELHQMFLGHDQKIKELEERNAALEKQNKELQELYTELAKRVERLDNRKTKNVNFTPMPAVEEKAAETVEEVQKTEEAE